MAPARIPPPTLASTRAEVAGRATYAGAVLVLLPPSESKAERRRGRPVDPARLSFTSLTPERARVAAALAAASAQHDAADLLGVSPTLTEDIDRNTRLDTAPSLPAGECYTGVLYDALDLANLDPASRRRAQRRIVVVSALYGAVRPADRIAPYRLSMAVSLPGVGPVAGVWREPLDAELTSAAGRGLVVDCRSSTYVAAWRPGGDLVRRWVQIRVPGATHMAKHTRGLVARALSQSPDDPRTPQGLAAVLEPTFVTELHPPSTARGPHVLDVTAR